MGYYQFFSFLTVAWALLTVGRHNHGMDVTVEIIFLCLTFGITILQAIEQIKESADHANQ